MSRARCSASPSTPRSRTSTRRSTLRTRHPLARSTRFAVLSTRSTSRSSPRKASRPSLSSLETSSTLEETSCCLWTDSFPSLSPRRACPSPSALAEPDVEALLVVAVEAASEVAVAAVASQEVVDAAVVAADPVEAASEVAVAAVVSQEEEVAALVAVVVSVVGDVVSKCCLLRHRSPLRRCCSGLPIRQRRGFDSKQPLTDTMIIKRRSGAWEGFFIVWFRLMAQDEDQAKSWMLSRRSLLSRLCDIIHVQMKNCLAHLATVLIVDSSENVTSSHGVFRLVCHAIRACLFHGRQWECPASIGIYPFHRAIVHSPN